MNEKNALVKISNDMISKARYKLTLTQYKLILFVMGKVRVEDQEFLEYNIPILDMVAATGLSPEGAYTRIEKEAIALMKKVWTIKAPNETGVETRTSLAWFASFYHEKGAGEVKVSFAPRLKPYLLQLKSHFTTYSLAYVLAMRSAYSIRIYEVLKMEAAFKSSAYFDLEEFKQTLQIDKMPCYKQYGHIKAEILLPALREISEVSDLQILGKIKETKEGHKVIGFKVFFEKKASIREEVLKSLATPSLPADTLQLSEEKEK